MNQTEKALPVLELCEVCVNYRQRSALQEITFSVQRGDVVAIVGPNGAGKSTMMKTILGLISPASGTVNILGQSVEDARKQVGYVPQMEQVDWDFPVTVADVAQMGRYAALGLFRRPKREDREAADAALQLVRMYDRRRSLIGELSSGQRRRVLLARALSSKPALLLMDEPLAGLDATAQHQFLDVVNDIQRDGTTVVFSTHDLVCASSRANKCLCLNCRMVAYGDPANVLTEDVLNDTFGTHLLRVHYDGHAYAEDDEAHPHHPHDHHDHTDHDHSDHAHLHRQ